MPNSQNISNEFVETAYTSKQIEKINEAECRIDCAFLNGIETTPLLENGEPFEKIAQAMVSSSKVLVV